MPLMTREMMEALELDGVLLEALTGEFHGPVFLPEQFFEPPGGGDFVPLKRNVISFSQEYEDGGESVYAACQFWRFSAKSQRSSDAE